MRADFQFLSNLNYGGLVQKVIMHFPLYFDRLIQEI